MKIKAPSNRPKTQRDIGTSRTRATQRRSEPQRGGKKKPKQDNTKLFIGIGVGAFFFIFIIIAAASGGSDNAPVNSVTSKTSSKPKFTLPIDIRRKIYAEYVAGENKIEDDAQSRTTADRSKGADIRGEVDRLKQSLRIDLREKWQQKHPGVTSSFIKSVISEGIKKNWGI